MIEFIIGFIFIVWLIGGLLPWIFDNWRTLACFSVVFAALYHVTGG